MIMLNQVVKLSENNSHNLHIRIQVRVWQITTQPNLTFGGNNSNNIQSKALCEMPHDAPVLCCTFTPDGQKLITGACDNKVRLRNLQTMQDQVIGIHDQPVKDVHWIQELSCVASASWDKSIRFWNGMRCFFQTQIMHCLYFKITLIYCCISVVIIPNNVTVHVTKQL